MILCSECPTGCPDPGATPKCDDCAPAVIVDNTSRMLLRYLRELYADEPLRPDEDYVVRSSSETIETHADWSRRVRAVRLLLGVRLVEAAIEPATS